MTGEIGQLALCLALALSVVQAMAGLVGARANGAAATAIAAPGSRGALLNVWTTVARPNASFESHPWVMGSRMSRTAFTSRGINPATGSSMPEPLATRAPARL